MVSEGPAKPGCAQPLGRSSVRALTGAPPQVRSLVSGELPGHRLARAALLGPVLGSRAPPLQGLLSAAQSPHCRWRHA